MADPRELTADIREIIESSVETILADTWTAFPISFKEFDKDKITSEVQPSIKSTFKGPDGKLEQVELDLPKDAPVYFQSAGGYSMTHPIKEGDEGIAIVSCRSIDPWHQQGSTQKQQTSRMHDLSDVMILPGIRSLPKAKELKNGVSTKSAQFRSDDNKNFYDVNKESDEGLTNKTGENIKNAVEKNMASKVKGQISNSSKEFVSEAQKLISKKAPKIFLNS